MSLAKHIKEHIILGGVPTNANAVGYSLAGGKLYLSGDSITAFGDTEYAGATGGFDVYGDGTLMVNGRFALSPIHRANYALGCSFTNVVNKGHPGWTTTQVLGAFATDVIANKPDWVYLMMGINDFANTTSAATLATIKSLADAAWANILACINMCQRTGIKVILAPVLPHRNSTDVPTQNNRSIGTAIINRYIRENAAKLPGVVLVDGGASVRLYATIANDTASAPDPQYFDSKGTPIGVHLNSLGGQRLAPVFYNALKSVVKPFNGRIGSGYDGSSGDPYNGLKNGAFIGTTGTAGTGVTGNVATSWAVQAYYTAFNALTTVACSKGTHWNSLYSNVPTQVLTVSNNPAVLDESYLDFSTNEYVGLTQTLTLSGSQFSVGDTIFFEAEVDVTETSAGDAVCTTLLLEFVAGATTPIILFGNAPGAFSTAVPMVPAADFVGGKLSDSTIRTPNFVIPTGTTAITTWMLMRTKGAGSAVWKWARAQISKVF